MNDVPWAAVVTGVSTLTGTLGAVLLTMWLTGRRNRYDRLWDLKRAAYSELLVSLKEAEVAARDAATILDDPSRSPTALGEAHAAFLEHQKKLRQRIAGDAIILPPSIADYYERSFADRGVAVPIASSKADQARAMAEHLKGVRLEIAAQARRDLGQAG
jgi:hypothetical protein